MNILDMKFEAIEVFDVRSLFTPFLSKDVELPQGFYRYDISKNKNRPFEPGMLAHHVPEQKLYGSIITKYKILDDDPKAFKDIYPGQCLFVWDKQRMTISEYLEAMKHDRW